MFKEQMHLRVASVFSKWPAQKFYLAREAKNIGELCV